MQIPRAPEGRLVRAYGPCPQLSRSRLKPPFRAESQFSQLHRTSIDRVAPSLHATCERSIVCLLTVSTRCLRLGLFLLSFSFFAAADRANHSTSCRSAGGPSTNFVASNSATNRTNGRTACRPVDCLTLLLLRAHGSRGGLARIKSALAHGPLVTFVFISILLLLGLSFRRIDIGPAGLCGRA